MLKFAGHGARMEAIYASRNLAEKPIEKRQLGRPRTKRNIIRNWK